MSTDLTGGLDIAREHVLAECPEPGIRDAVNVWIEEEHAAFGMRIGVEAASPDWGAHEYWLDIAFSDGRVISGRDTGQSHPPIGPEGQPTVLGTGPLRFRCVEPFRRWTAVFKGTAPEITTMDLISGKLPEQPPMRDIEIDIEMEMAAPPGVSGTLLPEAGAILSGGVEGEYMSPRYEQLFRTKGTLRVGDERCEFNGNGLRIRRQGARKFEGFWGHCWQSALFPSGRAFGYNTYPPRADGKPSFNEGFIFDGTGKLKPARAVQIPWMTRLLP